MLLFIMGISFLCAVYLYFKVESKRVEWALYGFLGNINALFYYWMYKSVWLPWKQGISLFNKE
jgi:hypothetical protein